MDSHQRKLSIIIPALNEENNLNSLLPLLQKLRREEYPNLEIIVSVNGSSDGTEAVARKYSDIVAVSEKKGLSAARNRGALKASGDFLIFLDADVRVNNGTLSMIAKRAEKNTIGSCTTFPDKNTFRAHLAVAFKNFLRWAGLIKGLSQLLFCDRSIIAEKKILFDPDVNIGELYDFIQRAIKFGGARYQYLRFPKAWFFSVDRFERNGYLKTLLFWINWIISTKFKGRYSRQMESEYWGPDADEERAAN